MSDQRQLLQAQLWDLRARCEQKLRALTTVQRLLDAYGDVADERSALKRKLLSELNQVILHDKMGLETALCCRDVAGDLPT